MQIKFVNTRRKLENGIQVVNFQLTDDVGNIYKWHANIPSGTDSQEWLEQNKEWILFLIRRREYPEMPAEIKTLEEVEKWLVDGCKVKMQIGVDENGEPVYGEKIAEKIKFKNTWG